MRLGLCELIRLISIFQCLFFAAFLVTHKKGRHMSNWLFSIFLVSKAFCYIDSLMIFWVRQLPAGVLHFLFMGQSFEFLLGPSLYFYTRSLLYKNFRFQRRDGWHLLPFLLHWIIYIPSYYIHSIEMKRQLLVSGQFFNIFTGILVPLGIYLFFIGYSLAALRLLHRYRPEAEDILSTYDHHQFLWLRFVIWGFICIWMFSLGNYILALHIGYQMFPYYIFVIGIFTFVNIIVFKGLKQPELFAGIDHPAPALKYGKNLLPSATQQLYLEKLRQFMDKEKPYLDPELTIGMVSEQLSIPSYYISQILNGMLKQNFYNFVNSYRIEESKRRLSSAQGRQQSVLDILYDCGFNSKSSFNSAFKKHTGMTPSEYKYKGGERHSTG